VDAWNVLFVFCELVTERTERDSERVTLKPAWQRLCHRSFARCLPGAREAESRCKLARVHEVRAKSNSRAAMHFDIYRAA
jgi:hypothetical protein